MILFAGIDVGGTNIKYVFTDNKGVILESEKYPTESKVGFIHGINKMARTLNLMEKKLGGKLEAVGIGCTGPVDNLSGVIENPYTLPGWEGRSMTDALYSRIKIPVFIDNDSNTAHIGELAAWDSMPSQSIMMTFGTGVGCSIRLGGELFRLPNGIHPEIGHISVGVDSRYVCYCGKSRCLENSLSGTAINRDALDLFGVSPELALSNQDTDIKKKFQERLSISLAEAVIELTVTFQPEVVIIGGGMQSFFEKYIIEKSQKRISHLFKMYGGTIIVPARQGTEAGTLGAALLAIQKLYK